MLVQNKNKRYENFTTERAQQMNQPQNDATIQVIAERINSMQNDVSDLRDTMRDSMEKMSIAITKLVQMEERQLFMNQSYDQ